MGRPSLTDRATSRWLGTSASAARPVIACTSSGVTPTRLSARFSTSFTRLGSTPIISSVSSPSFVFFSAGASTVPTMQMSVDGSIAAMISGVKPGEPSTMIQSSVARTTSNRRAEELDADGGRLIRPGGCL